MNVFSTIYRTNAWNGIETRSGPGSHREPTRRVIESLEYIMDWLGYPSVVDVGCGEGLWMPEYDRYMGIDIAPEAIEVAKLNHPDRIYMVWDGRSSLGRAGLMICRDVIQHLSRRDGMAMLAAIKASQSGYLLASTYIDGVNERIETGDAYRPNLEAEPFNLPPALLLIHDGYEYHDGDAIRDPAKMLGLWRL